MTPPVLRVLVVDDHDVVHWGFRLMLGKLTWVERCLAARSGAEAYALAARYEPHVAVVDLFVGEESGLELCARVREVSRATNVLLISGAGRISAETARAAGALGFVSKDLAAADVSQAIRMVGLGMSVFSSDGSGNTAELSRREREVLELVAQGATNREIGLTLHLSHHTVKGHASAVYRKLGAKNRAEAVQKARRLGLGV